MTTESAAMPSLRRELGLSGAVITGLGSILGTGVFVSIAIAAEVSGAWVMLAAPLAALVAMGNGLSSAQLAAAHPVAGGTYEYGYRFLGPWAGYTAGWLFLTAKSASAATAALGVATYTLALTGGSQAWRTPLAFASVVVITGLVVAGIRRTASANLVLVSITIVALMVFVAVGGAQLIGLVAESALPTTIVERGAWWRVLPEATALMFVAYTGYGRIATLGEEVRDPEHVIPRAVIVTLAVSAALYSSVAVVGWKLGGDAWRVSDLEGETVNAPLAVLLDGPAERIVEFGAIAAMNGVLVNLVLGLSRVWLAMARRADLPRTLAVLDAASNPTRSVLLTGGVVAAITLLGDLRLAWSFSAFTVLAYYAITNAAALRLPPAARRFPRWVAMFGLASCAFLAIWVDPIAVLMGTGIIVAAVIGRVVARRFVSGTA